MKNLSLVSVFIFILFSLISCKKEDNNEPSSITKETLDGYIQKGPFLNGTSVTLYELDETFIPTGRVYTTQIIDNSGFYSLTALSLMSQYVVIKADGYFFNEVYDQNSSGPITLYSLSDLTNRNSVNINILSNLEKSRIEYLLSQGLSYSIAREQAEREVLKTFSITKTDIESFDQLDISESGEDNAILLAISLIIEGYRTESELGELIANICSDIREDGVLDSPSLGSQLIDDAKLLNLPQIRTNIENRYSSLGLTVTIPDFEKYINVFIDSTDYQFTKYIVYPEFSFYGENILFEDKISFTFPLSIAANLPIGAALKIELHYNNSGGVFLGTSPKNWTIYSNSNETVFIATETGKDCDVLIDLVPSTYTIYYYENNAIIPNRTKTIIKN